MQHRIETLPQADCPPLTVNAKMVMGTSADMTKLMTTLPATRIRLSAATLNTRLVAT